MKEMETIKNRSYRNILIRSIVIIGGCFFAFNVQGQDKYKNDTLGLYNAKKELKQALSDITTNNPIKQKDVILDTKDKAINFAEIILFDIYGKEEIEGERPYKIFSVDNYWIIKGTLNADLGGTFLMIVDSHDCRILRLTHGK